MYWGWLVGYFVVGMIVGIIVQSLEGGWDNTASDTMILGVIVVFWPMIIPLVIVIGLGKIVHLLGKVIGGDR